MKKLLIFLFSLLISFNSYGEWKKIASNDNGTFFYLDEDTFKQNGGYVYSWILTDYLKPVMGDLSTELYVQSDCSTGREKHLAFNSYSKSMGRGTRTKTFTPPDQWVYPSPGSVNEILSNYICDYID